MLVRLGHENSLIFTLPLEIRQDIYSHVLPSSTFRLRSQMTATHGPQPKTPVADLLTICHIIHREATQVFYEEARIHYSMSWQTPRLTIDMTPIRLPMLRHLSVEFCCVGFNDHALTWSTEFSEIDEEKSADAQIAAFIDCIAANCPLLRTFTLHLLSTFFRHKRRDDRVSKDFLQQALRKAGYRPSHTTRALRNLKVRDAIAIVGHSAYKEYVYKDLQRAIAPLREWKTIEEGTWPGITLTRKQKLCVGSVTPRASSLCCCIWYYQPPGSIALMMPNPQLE